MYDPRCRVWERLSPWGLWTCNPRYRVWEGSPWRLWLCEPRCRVWEVGSLLGLLTCYPRCMVWERVTL